MPSDYSSMANEPDFNPDGGFPDKAAVTGRNKPQPGKGLEQIDGGGMQSGSHPAKSQYKTMRFFG